MEGGGEEGGVVVRGRAEIDTRQPFRSVKEAINLFGEKVLAGEIYANKLKEMQARPRDVQNYPTRIGSVTSELEETKETLQKTKEEGNLMAYCLQSLKQELEQTRKELQQLKSRKYEKKQQFDDDEDDDDLLEIEELKFVENPPRKIEVQEEENNSEFQKKRSVKFASPPLLTRVMETKDIVEDVKITSPSSTKKQKRKPLIPMFGGLFSKKEGKQRK